MVKNIISNYIPHQTVGFADADWLWTNTNLEQLIPEMNEIYKKYVKENKDPKIFDIVKFLQHQLNL